MAISTREKPLDLRRDWGLTFLFLLKDLTAGHTLWYLVPLTTVFCPILRHPASNFLYI